MYIVLFVLALPTWLRMKKTLLFVCSMLSIHLLLAQETTWSINIAPTLSHRIAPLQGITRQAAAAQYGEVAMHAFDVGVDLRTSINDRFAIGTGLFYSQKGFSNVHVAAAYREPFSRAYIIDFVQDYLDIPFFTTYTFHQGSKFRWYVLAGINNSLLLREKNNVAVRSAELATYEVPHKVREVLQQPYLGAPRRHSIGTATGLGVRATVDERTFIGLEAISKFVLTPLNDEHSGTERHQYSLGLNFRFIRTLR